MKDRVLIRHEGEERKAELLKTKLEALSAIASAISAGSKPLVNQITDTLDKYLASMAGDGSPDTLEEDPLMKDYDEIMNMKVQLAKTDKGIELQKV